MYILLIEDDGFKAKRIATFMRERLPGHELVIERSVSAGLTKLFEAPRPEALLLDMSLTTFDVGPRETGGRPQNFGGIAVLEHMARREVVMPVIVVTQFETFPKEGRELSLGEIREDLKRKFPDSFAELVYFSSRETVWEESLKQLIESLQLDKRA